MSATAAVNATAAQPIRRLARWGAGVVIGQAAVCVVIGVLTSTIYPQSHDPASPSFYSWGAVLTAMHVVLWLGVAGLIATRAAGSGVLAVAAYTVLLAGLALQAVAEALLRFAFGAGDQLFGIAVPVTALGLIILGAAIVRARTWRGWSRLVPFACGLYIPFVLLPAFGAAHGVSFPAIAGWNVLFLLLGAAMWREAPRSGR